jgi:hypothetical protein
LFLCRLRCAAVAVVLLTACAIEKPIDSGPESEADVAQCISRETQAVIRQSEDIEVATRAVMTRCHYEDEMEDKLRVQIALARTRGLGR